MVNLIGCQFAKNSDFQVIRLPTTPALVRERPAVLNLRVRYDDTYAAGRDAKIVADQMSMVGDYWILHVLYIAISFDWRERQVCKIHGDRIPTVRTCLTSLRFHFIHMKIDRRTFARRYLSSRWPVRLPADVKDGLEALAGPTPLVVPAKCVRETSYQINNRVQ